MIEPLFEVCDCVNFCRVPELTLFTGTAAGVVLAVAHVRLVQEFIAVTLCHCFNLGDGGSRGSRRGRDDAEVDSFGRSRQ